MVGKFPYSAGCSPLVLIAAGGLAFVLASVLIGELVNVPAWATADAGDFEIDLAGDIED